VVLKPAAFSQRASAGPAIPAPEMRTELGRMRGAYQRGPAELWSPPEESVSV
jgi:hypothetical protein